MKNTLIVILGATGIGKTDLSIRLAQGLETDIISSDSRQIFREMRIGTAVPSEAELQSVKHHFIQNKSVFDYYSAGMYELEVLELLQDIFSEKQTALLVGGSGMYIDAVCKGIDDLPEIDMDIRNMLIAKLETEGVETLRFELKRLDSKSYQTIDLQNPKRILKALEITLQTGQPYSDFLTKPKKKRDFNIVKIGLERPREELYARIDTRVDAMLAAGLEHEARTLYPHKHLNALNTVGYKELFAYFDGEITLYEAVRQVKRNSRHYAKRQLTWFKRDTEIAWFHPENSEIFDFVKKHV